MFVVEWTPGWGEPFAVHTFDDWIKVPVGIRNFFSETVEARDELDAYMQARGARYVQPD